MKKIIILLMSFWISSYAIPAYKGKISFKQSDGTTFSGYLKGDEWFSWVEDTSQQVVKYNRQSKDYEYALVQEVEGELDLLPSGIKVGAMLARSLLVNVDKSQLYIIWKRKKEEALKREE